jgi:trehalose 6-phosphate phosphatase
VREVADVVSRLRADPADTALLLDFDGTLAPIVAGAGDARPLPGAPEVLAALSESYGVVAIVSGRPLSFLAEHVGPGPILIGLYGLESQRGGEVVAHPDALPWRSVLDEVAVEAERVLPAGVDVEHKGLSVTLHVRPVPEALEEVRAFAQAMASRTGLERRVAKMSEELHPPVAVDKGTVLQDLAGSLGTVAYAGDDVGDRPAFEALDELRAEGRETLRLVVDSAELDPALRAQADLLLPDPTALLSLLVQLR